MSLQGYMIGRADQNGPQGDGINEDVSFTLNTTDRHAVAYGIGSYHSNAWKSDNPNSGVYEADTAKTLDSLNCGYPGCNQGGMAVVQPVTFEPGIAKREGGHIYEGVSGTIRANAGDNQMAVAYSIENHPADSRVDIDESGMVQTLTSRMGTGGGNVPMVMEPITIHGEPITGTLLARDFKGAGRWDSLDKVVCCPVGTYQETGIGWWNESDVGATIRAMSGGDSMKANLVVAGVDCRNATEYPEMNATLQSDAAHNLNSNNVVRVKHIVRRLTPLECERLQGFPDGWTDIGEWVDSKGKKHKEADSPRYKALGNSIALPPWKWVLKRLCACYERDATMASLFDGIGGFPYIWEQLNGKGSCLWASEIEEFPMAVTKVRFQQ
jgi:DNA (cytosine-5)-methyltransferase 1